MSHNDVINAYEEVLNTLKRHDKTEKDVLWVGTDEWRYDSTDLKTIFGFEYEYSAYETPFNPKIVIVGSDWWLEIIKHEDGHMYDSDWWWEFKALHKCPQSIVPTESCYDEE